VPVCLFLIRLSCSTFSFFSKPFYSSCVCYHLIWLLLYLVLNELDQSSPDDLLDDFSNLSHELSSQRAEVTSDNSSDITPVSSSSYEIPVEAPVETQVADTEDAPISQSKTETTEAEPSEVLSSVAPEAVSIHEVDAKLSTPKVRVTISADGRRNSLDIITSTPASPASHPTRLTTASPEKMDEFKTPALPAESVSSSSTPSTSRPSSPHPLSSASSSSSSSHPISSLGHSRLPSILRNGRQVTTLTSEEVRSLGELRINRAAGATTNVKTVHRTTHVSYDPETGKYRGLPKEWEDALKKQFGLPITLAASTKLEQYTSRIPNVLITMKDYLLSHDGLEQKGIFRLAPDATACKIVKDAFDSGSFNGCDDVNIVANLIKVWFRDLPVHILGCADPQAVTTADTMDKALEVIRSFPEPNQSVIWWLLDLCVDIAKNSEVNLMTPKNLSICISPNLFKAEAPHNATPAEALAAINMAKRYTDFFEKAILAREKQRIGQL